MQNPNTKPLFLSVLNTGTETETVKTKGREIVLLRASKLDIAVKEMIDKDKKNTES